MAPTQSPERPNLVFLQYKGRNVVTIRPKTHREAIILATRYFRSLEHTPLNRIVLSARLPQYPAQGVVEIHPDSWEVASKDVEVFEVDEADVRDEPTHSGRRVERSESRLVPGSHACPTGWQSRSRALERIEKLRVGGVHKIGPTVHEALRSGQPERSEGSATSGSLDSSDAALTIKGTEMHRQENLERQAKLLDHEEEHAVEITPEAQQLASNAVRNFTVQVADEKIKAKEIEVMKKEREEEYGQSFESASHSRV
ncbi:hypothetical protein M407DRAFT_4697 [Tulasnella calospora MUT 4182]|uniref:Uncharacterized protein n=1 Tax=Tulasnella calospora MUT 4182 TaxID=1051891 RepID=A0A0C3QSW4_9AGAM|nr:hypothetical protein M407DRAFT_4697 [Tulasnella calospora MUT 4182]